MARHSPAIAAAELRVTQARRELHGHLLRLRRSLARPSCLAAAALFGFALGRRDGKGIVAGMLARTLLRRPKESPWT
jgi:hypothetical protein